MDRRTNLGFGVERMGRGDRNEARNRMRTRRNSPFGGTTRCMKSGYTHVTSALLKPLAPSRLLVLSLTNHNEWPTRKKKKRDTRDSRKSEGVVLV